MSLPNRAARTGGEYQRAHVTNFAETTPAPDGNDIARYAQERALIGAVLRNPVLYSGLAAILEPGDFWSKYHYLIWGVMNRMVSDGETINYVGLAERLERLNSSVKPPYTGDALITDLMMFGKDCPDASEGAARGYAEAVLLAALKIRLLNYANSIKSAVSGAVEGDRLVATVTEGLYTATDRRARKPQGALSVSIRYDKAMDALMNTSSRPTLLTGLTDLDACIDELLPGEYTIVGNDTGGGKTTFAVTVAYNAAKAGRRVVYVTGEMTEKEIYDGFVSAESGIPRPVLRTGRLTGEQLTAYAAGLERASKLPLTIIDDIEELTPLKVFNRLLPVAQQQGIDLIVWDQLWLTKLDVAFNQQRPSRPLELREVVDYIKRKIALHPVINAHVLLLQQYKGDRDKDTPPKMSDFAESSDPARRADFVFLMERTNKGANVHIGKNRSSGRYVGRRVELTFDYEHSIYRSAPAVPFSAASVKGGAR